MNSTNRRVSNIEEPAVGELENSLRSCRLALVFAQISYTFNALHVERVTGLALFQKLVPFLLTITGAIIKFRAVVIEQPMPEVRIAFRC